MEMSLRLERRVVGWRATLERVPIWARIAGVILLAPPLISLYLILWRVCLRLAGVEFIAP